MNLLLQTDDRLFVGQLSGVVGVKVRLTGHRQNLTGIDVHHDAKGTLLDLVLADGDFQMLLHKVLDNLIDGQHQRVAVLRLIQFFILERHFSVLSIFGRNDSAFGAGQNLVVVRFQAVGAAIVIGIDKTEHRCCQVIEGVNPLGSLAERDAVDIIFLHEQLDGIRRLLLHAVFQHLPIRAGVFGAFADGSLVGIDQRRQTCFRVAQYLQFLLARLCVGA